MNINELKKMSTVYDLQEPGVGDYFWDCIIADIESLIIYAGIHRQKLGLFQMFAKRYVVLQLMPAHNLPFPLGAL